jgi:hypothetical protein
MRQTTASTAKPSLTFRKLKNALIDQGYDIVLTSRCINSPTGIARQLEETVKGYIEPDEGKIYINKKLALNDRVVTLIHELIHEIKPRWSELKVESEAVRLFKKLTVSELGFFQYFVLIPGDTLNFMR